MWKKSSLKILAIVIIVILILMGLNWFVDPFMKFRVNEKLKYFYTYADERYIDSGIAKHMDYDTAVVGTSMVENFSITDVDKVMNVKSVKLPFSGGSGQEFNILLQHLLSQDKANTIIYGLDYFSYKNMVKDDGFKMSEPPFPREMYDDGILSNLKYLISYNTLKQTFNVLQNSYYRQTSKSYQRAFCWYQDCHFNEEAVQNFWKERNETDRKNKYDKKDFNFLALKKNFDAHTLSVINTHKDIHFIIFLPPYSYLSWKHSHETGSLDNIIKFQEYVLKTLVQYGNVKVYDFQQEPFIYDLSNYKDLYHYSEKINHLILERIQANKNLVNRQNLDEHMKQLHNESIKWKKTSAPKGFDEEE
jgi:hypothetical protein